MNTINNFVLEAIFLMIVLTVPSFGQESLDRQGVVYNQIAPLIQGKYGQSYHFNYTMLDTAIYHSDDDNIQDPYGTLKGCILFSAYIYQPDSVPNNFIVGMIRNEQIIWDNFPGSEINLSFDSFYGTLLFSQDINNDGEVDLVFADCKRAEISDAEGDTVDIRILSWNGTRGRFINGYVIGSGDVDLLDVDGSGIKCLRVKLFTQDETSSPEFKTSTFPYVTYGWNGTQYGLWPNVRQIPEDEILPANRFDATVSCRVNKSNGVFQYSYAVANQQNSEQEIDWISIGGIEDTSSYYAPPPWTAGTSVVGGRRFSTGFDKLRFAIKPGKTLSGFTTQSVALPIIVSYYLQGNTGTTCCPTEEQARQNILTNSVTGYTLGTRDTTITVGSLQWLDTLTSYATQSLSLGWIKDQATANKYLNYFATAKTSLQQNNLGAARSTLQRVLQDVNTDSTNNLTSEAYALIRYNTEYLLAQLPVPPSGFIVKLVNSSGSRLTSGSLQYYEGSWKDATNNNDGTFTISSTAKTLSLRMTYEYGTQTKSNVAVGTDTVIFQTVNVQIKLQDSKGNPMDTGTVQYYAGAWRNLGSTANGVATKELLPNSYSFRTTYAYGSNDKQQDIGTNPTVVFQTINAAVQLQDSHGNLMPAPSGDQGTVQYYSGAWKDFGTTSNGITTKELLPNSYSFRMTYASGSNDKQQNIGTNPTVVFQTVNATVQLKNSQGNLIDTGTVQYYAGAWRNLGTTTGGLATKELLPNNYSFRMTYAYVSNDKAQDISTNSTVAFSTVLCTITVTNSQSQPVNNVQASYYSGAWWQIGPTVNGQVTKELLPANLTFRITYGTTHQDKTQNLATNNVVGFSIP